MKKLFAVALLLSMLLTSCGRDKNNGTNNAQNGNNSNQNGMMGEMGETVEEFVDDILPGNQNGSNNGSGNNNGNTNNNGNGSNNGNGNGNGKESDSTLGDENGDGKVETDGDNTMMNGGTNGIDGETTQFEPVTEVKNADDAVNFIAANVYNKCADAVPMMTETRVLSKDDLESVTYNTGLTDVTGIHDIILSESMVGSFAYSLVMLRTDGSSTEELQKAMNAQINPAKWVCVAAEAVRSVTLDDDVLLVMGGTDQVDTIMTAVTEAAADVYTNVGSVMSVMG